MITPLAVFLDQCPCPKCSEPPPGAFVLLPTSVEVADAVCRNCGYLVQLEIVECNPLGEYKKGPTEVDLSPRRRHADRLEAGTFTDIIVMMRAGRSDGVSADQDHWLIAGSDLEASMFEIPWKDFQSDVFDWDRFRLVLPPEFQVTRIFRDHVVDRRRSDTIGTGTQHERIVLS